MTINNMTMTRTGTKFIFNKKELNTLYFALALRVRDITDNYSNKLMVKMCKKEIDLLEQIKETL